MILKAIFLMDVSGFLISCSREGEVEEESKAGWGGRFGYY